MREEGRSGVTAHWASVVRGATPHPEHCSGLSGWAPLGPPVEQNQPHGGNHEWFAQRRSCGRDESAPERLDENHEKGDNVHKEIFSRGETTMTEIGVADIRANLADVINRVAYGGERIVLKRRASRCGRGVDGRPRTARSSWRTGPT